MSSLFNNKQQKIANKYSTYMSKATNQGNTLVADFFNSISPDTIQESFELIHNKGHEHEKNSINPIEMNYNSGIELSADDLIQFNDIFTSVTKRLENNGDD